MFIYEGMRIHLTSLEGFDAIFSSAFEYILENFIDN